MRIIKVVSCNDCLYRGIWDNEDGTVDWTCGAMQFLVISKTTTFPQNCPLEERQQEERF